MKHSSIRRAAAVSFACAAAVAAVVPATATATIPVNLRVLTHSGKTLADYVQYTGSTTVQASRKARCFGSGNPSSNHRYKLKGASLLSVLADAARHDARVRPLLLTDAFASQGFGLGVCGIGGYVAQGASFWYEAADAVSASTGPNLVKLRRGDSALWYLTSGSESGFPNELVLHAPVRVRANQPYSVRVVRIASDGTRAPASGVTVSGATAPTDANGTTTEPGTTAGATRLRATGTADDIPSEVSRVCVSSNLSKCPAKRGRRIFGTPGADRIVLKRGGADHVKCGPGRDVVVAHRGDGDDRIAKSCEKVIRK
jgi:hypothetical protein